MFLRKKFQYSLGTNLIARTFQLKDMDFTTVGNRIGKCGREGVNIAC